MAGSVGNLNVKLMADPSPMGPGLAAGQSSLVAWAADVAKKSQIAGQALGSGMDAGANAAAAALSKLSAAALSKPINLGGITDPAKMALAGNDLAKSLVKQMAGLQELAKASGFDLATLVKASPAQIKTITAKAGQDAVQGMIAAARSAAAAGQPLTVEMTRLLALTPAQANALGQQAAAEMAKGAAAGQGALARVGAATGTDPGKLAGMADGDLARAAQQAASSMGQAALATNNSWKGRLAAWFGSTAGWIGGQFSRLWQGVKSIDLGGLIVGGLKGLRSTLQGMAGFVDMALSNPIGAARMLLDGFAERVSGLASYLGGAVSSMASAMSSAVGGLASSLGQLSIATVPIGAILGIPLKALSGGIDLVGKAVGGLVSVAGGAIATVASSASALLGIVGDVYKVYKQGAGAIIDTGKAAQRLGMDVSQYQVLARASGLESEAFEKVMFRLSRELASAGTSAVHADNAFGKLGLSAHDLLKMAPLERMGAIFDAINKMGDSAFKSAAAFEIFGKQGSAMGMGIAKGSAGIARAASDLDRFGLSITAADFAMAFQAGRALKQLDAIKQGLINQLAVGVAPILATLTEQLNLSGLSARGLSGLIIDAFEWVGKKVAQAIDWVRKYIPTWDQLKATFLSAKDELLSGLGKLGEVGQGLLDKLNYLPAVWESVKASAMVAVNAMLPGLREVLYVIERVRNMGRRDPAPTPAAGADAGKQTRYWENYLGVLKSIHNFGSIDLTPTKSFGGSFAEGQAAAEQTRGGLGSLGMTIWDTFSGPKTQAAFDAFKGMLGGTKREVAGLAAKPDDWGKLFDYLGKTGLGESLGGITKDLFGNFGLQTDSALSIFERFAQKVRENMKKAFEPPKGPSLEELYRPRLDKLQESLKSPLSEFQKQWREVQDLTSKGAFTLPGAKDLGFQTMGAEFEKLRDKYKAPEVKSPAAVLAGSREAYSAVVKFQQPGQGTETVQQTLTRIAQEQAERDKEQIRLGKEVADALKGGGPTVRGIEK